MSNQERESLVFRIEQLEQNHQALALDMAEMKRQLQDALSQLHQQVDERSAHRAPVEVVNVPPEDVSYKDEIQPQSPQIQSYEYQLVFDRSGSRAVLIEALEKAQKRLIIVCPWLSRNSIDADLLQKFRDCLNRNCRIDIGWGYLSGWGKTSKSRGNNAIRDLRQLEHDYPEQFKLKLLGTHEKFLVCDDSFTFLGSHNMLTSNTQGVTREVGIRTTDPQIIQGLINRFDGAFDTEVLDVQDIGEESTASLASLDDYESDVDEDTDNYAESSQEPAIDTEEFWRLYREKEQRNFSGMNLAGLRLSVDPNLNDLNLSRAYLSGINLTRPKLIKTDLSEANLSQANLSWGNLTKANLQRARLLQTNLSQANLSQANLSWANLTGATLSHTILIQANLKYANLTAADLSKAQLKDALLKGANLSGANLAGVNLVGLNFHGVNLSGATLSETNLCGANLSHQNLSGANLTKADLRGANLEKASLEKANLTGANLGGANLLNAKLSGAIMPDGTVHE